jgi:hypothetical protein
LYTPRNGDVEHCCDHRRIFKTLQQSNTNLMRMLEKPWNDVGPIVDAGRFSNNSLDAT